VNAGGLSDEDMATLQVEIEKGIREILTPLIGETMHPAFVGRNAMVRIEKWINGVLAADPTQHMDPADKTGRGR
jgi:hypothetical protein